MRNIYREAFSVLGVVVLVFCSTVAMAGSKKLMTVNAAKVVAERAVAESVVGLKIRSQDTVVNLVAKHMKIESKIFAAIKGINYTDIVYDKAKDIAKVTATMQVYRVGNIIGDDIDYGGMVIKRVGFATSTPSMAKPLQALRAAELDAYKQLAKQIIGFKIGSKSSVENYILQSDTIKAKVLAAIWGAELTGYRWDKDGDAYVTLKLRTGLVIDVMGQAIDYRGEVIEVEGVGAQKDDFSKSQKVKTRSAGFTKVGSEVREGTIDVPAPVAGAMNEKDEAAGGGSQLRP